MNSAIIESGVKKIYEAISIVGRLSSKENQNVGHQLKLMLLFNSIRDAYMPLDRNSIPKYRLAIIAIRFVSNLTRNVLLQCFSTYTVGGPTISESPQDVM